MNNLHLALVGLIQPTIEIFNEAGLPVDKLLRKSGLHRYDLTYTNGYIPLSSVYKFLDMMSCELDRANLSAVFRDKIKMANAGFIGEGIGGSLDLFTAIDYGIKHNKYLIGNERVKLEINGPVTTVQQYYIDKHMHGRDEAELLSFCLLYDGIKMSAGPKWSPYQIRIQGPEIQEFDSVVPDLKGTQVLFNQSVTSISFPTELLTEPMLNNPEGQGKIDNVELPGDNLSSKLEHLMNSSNRPLDLVSASMILEVSERSMKRYLKEEGGSFKKVVEKWRFKKALKLLNESDKTINEISQRLHYSNPSNFIRAFMRWTDSTPMHYRNNLN